MKRFLKLSFLVFISVVLLGSSQVNARDLKITASAKTIYVKQRIQMQVKPSSQKGSIKWKTTDRKIATVSQSGIVTGKKAGKVKVYAISTDNGKKKASYTIRVKEFKERSLQVKSRIVSFYDKGGKCFGIGSGKKYRTLDSEKAVGDYLKSVRKTQNYGGWKKELKKYKKSFFRKKSLCIVYITAGSSSMPVKVKEVRLLQNKKGKVLGSVYANIGGQSPGVMWAGDVKSYYAVMEIDKKDADIIQIYKVVKK